MWYFPGFNGATLETRLFKEILSILTHQMIQKLLFETWKEIYSKLDINWYYHLDSLRFVSKTEGAQTWEAHLRSNSDFNFFFKFDRKRNIAFMLTICKAKYE